MNQNIDRYSFEDKVGLTNDTCLSFVKSFIAAIEQLDIK